MKILHLLLIAFCLPLFSSAQINRIFIDDVRVIDVLTGEVAVKDVLIKDDNIVKVETDFPAPENVTALDGRGKFLMPGLVDAHIHLFQSGGLYTRPDAIDLTAYRPYEVEIRWLRQHANSILRRYLRCGITSVMDVGGPMSNYEIRNENQQSEVTPSLFVTGPLISTYQPEAFKIKDPPIIKVSTSREAVDLVRKQIPFEPDFIKIWYITLPGQTAESTYDIVKATIEESHNHGVRVAVHATQLNTAKLALKAGADVLVHSVQDHIVDEDFIALIRDNDAVYIPTLIVSANYGKVFTATLPYSNHDFLYSHPKPLGSTMDLRHLANGTILEQTRENEKAFAQHEEKQKEIMAKNLKILQQQNIPIATGTDAGNIGTFHASSYFSEIQAMHEAGLTNHEIIRASTLGGALALGKASEFGTIEAGRRADLLLLEKNPLEDLEALDRIDLIIKNGELINPDTIIKMTAEDLVQQQLNGYNARDIDAFLAPYSDDIEIYDFPDKLRKKGKDHIRNGYVNMFNNTPNLHCELKNRIILGNTVVDQEFITGFGNKDPLEALAIYKIEHGKIAKVYFVQKDR